MRLFVGVPLPDEVTERLAQLCSGLKGARWVDPENMHVTLRFIGGVDGAQAEDLDAALVRVCAPGFSLSLAGLGCFESKGRARVVWAALERSDALRHLHAKVESAAVRAGFEPERRKLKGHITIGRLKDTRSARVGPWLESRGPFSAGPFAVDRFVLYESQLNRDGAHYEALRDYPLTGE